MWIFYAKVNEWLDDTHRQLARKKCIFVVCAVYIFPVLLRISDNVLCLWCDPTKKIEEEKLQDKYIFKTKTNDTTEKLATAAATKETTTST